MADETEQIWVTCFQESAEQLLGCSSEQLGRWKDSVSEPSRSRCALCESWALQRRIAWASSILEMICVSLIRTWMQSTRLCRFTHFPIRCVQMSEFLQDDPLEQQQFEAVFQDACFQTFIFRLRAKTENYNVSCPQITCCA